MKVLNLTQHAATPDQLAVGVVDLPADIKEQLVKAITFPAAYTAMDLRYRAKWVAGIVDGYNEQAADADKITHLMIGGMPSFMPPLQAELLNCGYAVGYACSERVSVDGADGKKVSVFKHSGFYWASTYVL